MTYMLGNPLEQPVAGTWSTALYVWSWTLLGMISAKFLFSLSLWASLFPSVAHALWAVWQFSSALLWKEAKQLWTGHAFSQHFFGGNSNSHHFAFGRLCSHRASSKPSFIFLKPEEAFHSSTRISNLQSVRAGLSDLELVDALFPLRADWLEEASGMAGWFGSDKLFKRKESRTLENGGKGICWWGYRGSSRLNNRSISCN